MIISLRFDTYWTTETRQKSEQNPKWSDSPPQHHNQVTCACARKHVQLISINGAPFTRLPQWPHDKSNNVVIAKDECRRGLSNLAPPGGHDDDWTGSLPASKTLVIPS